jgi:transposase-like protein
MVSVSERARIALQKNPGLNVNDLATRLGCSTGLIYATKSNMKKTAIKHETNGHPKGTIVDSTDFAETAEPRFTIREISAQLLLAKQLTLASGGKESAKALIDEAAALFA